MTKWYARYGGYNEFINEWSCNDERKEAYFKTQEIT